MAGIYIHIPFCKQACHYCDFHFSTSLDNKSAFVEALKKEMNFQKNYLSGEKISTVYLGGGTPSILSQKELSQIFESLHEHFDIAENAEITLEANPDDLTEEKIKQLAASPVNRLSIGIQSFYDDDLRMMNRAHNSGEALDAVKFAQENGFDNISIDLIYGSPGLSDHQWRNNLQIAFALNVKHISAYCLTVEPRTALAHQVKIGQVPNVSEQHSSAQFEIMLAAMHYSDYIQYEISNFCKDGAHSKHNTNYWLKEKYLGLGPSAHSYNGASRQWNVSNNAAYIRSLSQDNDVWFEKEELTSGQQYNEYIMTSLRTIWGTDINYIASAFGEEIALYCSREVEKYVSSGNVLLEENKLFLTDKGKLIADRIASDLFII